MREKIFYEMNALQRGVSTEIDRRLKIMVID